MHVLEPYWNEVRITQLIGRAVRQCSHADLPMKERYVDVYRYLAIRKNNKETTDENIQNLANRKDATIYIYNFLSPSVRKKDGLNIYPLICFTCNKLSKWAYDGLNESGNAKFKTEYFETRNITKADQNEALSEARIWGHFLQILKLKNLKTGL